MRLQALKARPRRRRLPPDLGERQATAVAANVVQGAYRRLTMFIWNCKGCRQVEIVHFVHPD
jgi:hypothetical protein